MLQHQLKYILGHYTRPVLNVQTAVFGFIVTLNLNSVSFIAIIFMRNLCFGIYNILNAIVVAILRR